MHDPAQRRAALLLGIATASMLIPLTIWVARDPLGFPHLWLGWGAGLRDVRLGWVLAGVLTVGYVSYTLWAVPFVRRNVRTVSSLKVLGICAALVSGLFEEMIFRKLLMDHFDEIGVSIFWQVCLSAVAFGVAHAAWALAARDIKIVAPTVISTMVLGLALAITYIVSDRLLLPVVLAHVTINLVIEPWLLLGAVSQQWRVPDAASKNL